MQTNSAIVRRLVEDDQPSWRTLLQAYCDFYRAQIDEDTTVATFSRLCAGNGMIGLVAAGPDGAMRGFANLVFHQSTWTSADCCYLEDLYVVQHCRGSGVARQLIIEAYAEADARSAAKIYWHTQEFNAPARSLYDTLAKRTSYVMYRR